VKGIIRSLIALTAAATGGAPTELRIFAKGKNSSEKGTFVFDEKAAEMVMAKAAERFPPTTERPFPFDYNHGSTDPLGMLNPELSGKAAGWCRLELRAGELWAVDIAWTKNALAAIEAKEWRFISPTFTSDKSGRVTSLFAVALQNTPALHNLDPLVAASLASLASTQDGWVPMCLGRSCSASSICCQACPCKQLCASMCCCTPPPDPSDPTQMSAADFLTAAKATKEKTMDQLLIALGLAASASQADGLTAITSLRDGFHKLITATGKVTLSEALGAIEGLKVSSGQVAQLSAKLTELEAASRIAEVNGLVEAALKDAKIAPAQKDWAIALGKADVAQLKAFLSVAPKLVVTEGKKPPEAGDGKTVQLSGADLAVAKLLAVDTTKLAATKAALTSSAA
jgi:phage I-like protein